MLSRKPVHDPADLAGMKIRTLPNPIITECLRLMGAAAATPMAFGEIYTALQAGVLDGLEHDPPTILASKFYETAKHYALTEHNFSPLVTYFSDATWQRMDPALRDPFLDAAGKAAIATRAHGLAVEKEALEVLKTQGRRGQRGRSRRLPQTRAATDRRIRQAAPRSSLRGGNGPPATVALMSAVAQPARAAPARITRPLLTLVDATAALLLLADLAVVCVSVLSPLRAQRPDRVVRRRGAGADGGAELLRRGGAPWRGGENVGVAFFVDRLPGGTRRVADAMSALVVTITAGFLAYHALHLGVLTQGQTTGSGLPLQWSFLPMGAGCACMAAFGLERLLARRAVDLAAAALIVGGLACAWLGVDALAPDWLPPGALMGAAFLLCLLAGAPIGFVLALSALVYVWTDGSLPGVVFAQQVARGIDNFVLLAIPFFILVGYVMEANGMSVRLIALLERLVGRVRGGLNVVMVLSMVVFSGISGSKMADVAAVGSVLIPAARRSRQDPGNAVALLAASAVMAEDDPALHQPHHPGLRRQPVDRRPVRGRVAAGRADGGGAGVCRDAGRHAGRSGRHGRAAGADAPPMERGPRR